MESDGGTRRWRRIPAGSQSSKVCPPPPGTSRPSQPWLFATSLYPCAHSRKLVAAAWSPRSRGVFGKGLQRLHQEPGPGQTLSPRPSTPTRFIPSFQSPIPIRGRPWGPVVLAPLQRPDTVLVERSHLADSRWGCSYTSGARRGPSFQHLQEGESPRPGTDRSPVGPEVVVHREGEPHTKVVREAGPHPPPGILGPCPTSAATSPSHETGVPAARRRC